MPLDNADEDALIADLMRVEPDPRQAVLDLVEMLSACVWAQKGERMDFQGFELEDGELVAHFKNAERAVRVPVEHDLADIVPLILESLS
ncbi:MAG: hypothetical protein ACLQJR_34600 [Stellaceae bacterium]